MKNNGYLDGYARSARTSPKSFFMDVPENSHAQHGPPHSLRKLKCLERPQVAPTKAPRKRSGILLDFAADL